MSYIYIIEKICKFAFSERQVLPKLSVLVTRILGDALLFCTSFVFSSCILCKPLFSSLSDDELLSVEAERYCLSMTLFELVFCSIRLIIVFLSECQASMIDFLRDSRNSTYSEIDNIDLNLGNCRLICVKD